METETDYTPQLVKEWTDYYYKDYLNGMSYYRPQRNLDRLSKIEVKVVMYKDPTEEQYVAYLATESGGPIASGASIEETETKFNEMFVFSIFAGALISLHAKEIEKILADTIVKHPQYLTEYKSGKTGLIGLFVGEVMKCLKGRGEPKMVHDIVVNYLDKL
jgi:hypothetical protein